MERNVTSQNTPNTADLKSLLQDYADVKTLNLEGMGLVEKPQPEIEEEPTIETEEEAQAPDSEIEAEQPEDQEDDITPLAGPEAEDPEKRKVFGEEAKKRIAKLVKERKELALKAEEERKLRQKLEEERQEFYVRQQQAELVQAQAVQHALNLYLEKAEAKLVKAREDGDITKESAAMRELMQLQMQKSQIDGFMASRANVKPEAKPVEKQKAASVEAAPVPQETVKKLQRWARENPWFDSQLHHEVLYNGRQLRSDDEEKRYTMTAAAEAIAAALTNQGYDIHDTSDPDFGQEAYFKELEKRLSKRFPELNKQVQNSSPPPAVPKTRPTQQGNPAAATTTVTYSAQERKLLESLGNVGGVSMQDIAKQTAKRVKQEGKK